MMSHIQTLVKYFISGGSATAVNLVVLYLLTDYAHIYYLTSGVLAFVVAFVVSFTLQKFWTFKDQGRERIHVQALQVFSVAVCNLGLNTLLLYTLTEYLHFHYFVSAVVASGLLAIVSFFVYRFIFTNTKASVE